MPCEYHQSFNVSSIFHLCTSKDHVFGIQGNGLALLVRKMEGTLEFIEVGVGALTSERAIDLLPGCGLLSGCRLLKIVAQILLRCLDLEISLTIQILGLYVASAFRTSGAENE